MKECGTEVLTEGKTQEQRREAIIMIMERFYRTVNCRYSVGTNVRRYSDLVHERHHYYCLFAN